MAGLTPTELLLTIAGCVLVAVAIERVGALLIGRAWDDDKDESQ